MTIERIQELVREGKLHYHHTSWARGYIKVDEPRVNSYEGQFGKGYTIDVHSPFSTRYHTVSYYVEEV